MSETQKDTKNDAQDQCGAMINQQEQNNPQKIKHDERGTIVFRPLEAYFEENKDLLKDMDPYCKFSIEFERGKSSIAYNQGMHPTWKDSIVLKVKDENFVKIKAKDKDRVSLDDRLGKAKIPLDEVLEKRKVTQWIPLYDRGKFTGKIHLEMEFFPKTLRS